MNRAAWSPRQAARQQLFQAEEVCLEEGREGALPHQCVSAVCLWRRCVLVDVPVCLLTYRSLPVRVCVRYFPRLKQQPGAI